MIRILRRITQLFKRIFLIEDGFLCDTCRYNWRSACNRPERPNARKCPDYKKK